jgi:hypothetical protein
MAARQFNPAGQGLMKAGGRAEQRGAVTYTGTKVGDGSAPSALLRTWSRGPQQTAVTSCRRATSAKHKHVPGRSAAAA